MKLHYPRAKVERDEDDWSVTLVFGGYWNNHPPVFIGAYSSQQVALYYANTTVRRERNRASFNPTYRYESQRESSLVLTLG